MRLTQIPKIKPTTKFLDLSENQITSMNTNIPEGVEWVDISYNPIKRVTNLPRHKLSKLDANSCRLETIEQGDFPDSVFSLSLSNNNYLGRMQNFPINLKGLQIGGKRLMKIENLPQGLVYFEFETFSSRNITMLENLPLTLEDLRIVCQAISKIENLPLGLKSLSLFQNNVSVVENIPDLVKFVDLSGNPIKKIACVPTSCKAFILNGKCSLDGDNVAKLRNFIKKVGACNVNAGCTTNELLDKLKT